MGTARKLRRPGAPARGTWVGPVKGIQVRDSPALPLNRQEVASVPRRASGTQTEILEAWFSKREAWA